MNDVYHFPLNETSTNHHHHHQQPHQDDDDPLNENYIALLHYRSPHHILDLSPQATPAEIRRAHAIRVDETRQALHLAETNGGGGGGASFMSRLNYLELKLRALDQALHSLLSSSSPVDRGTFDSSRHDDELDTIDIYFRPRPIAQRSTSWSSSASRHSLDNVSSVSWDVSRQAPDDDDDGVSQVLGPLHVDASLAKKKKKQPPSNESPRSIVDLTLEDEDVFDIDRTADRNRHRHKPPKPASHVPIRPTTIPTAQCTIEAARKGVLRALSEDDSECLPLDEDEYDPPRPTDDPHASHWVKRTAPEEPREGQVPREKVVTWDTTTHATRPVDEDPPESHRSASSQPSASPRSETSERRVSAGTHTDRHTPHVDLYDALLRSGMAFAHDLCGLLGVCWEAGNDTTTTHGIFVSPGEGMDEESYLVHGGAEDDDEYGADGESYSALDSVGGGSYAGRGGREKKMLV